MAIYEGIYNDEVDGGTKEEIPPILREFYPPDQPCEEP